MGFFGGRSVKKREKLLFSISLACNVLLILIIIWGYQRVSFATEQLFIREVQHKLVELEGLIAHQMENDWVEPHLVTTKSGEVINALRSGLFTAEYLHMLSKKERELINSLISQFKYYPQNETYRFAEVSEEEREDLEALRELLRDAGLGMRIRSGWLTWKNFIDKMERLDSRIKAYREEKFWRHSPA